LYDSNIAWLCSDVRDYGGQVLIRWGHEMENITGRYPWASQDGSAYIDAYRYFVSKCRSIAPKASYIWSPAGNKNLAQYWPGQQFVDYIGITVFDYAEWEQRFYGYNRSFSDNWGERYSLVRDYGVPVIITEFGATGPDRAEWVAGALKDAANEPDIKSVVFFNAQDPVSWGQMPAPDWRVNPTSSPSYTR
jgi:beta-mannanase